jgi:knotted carbamoyltransferase YgeW
MEKIREKLGELQRLSAGLYGSDFLLSWEKSLDEIKAVVLTAEILKQLHTGNVSARIFDSGIAVSNFRDNSTRTRYSFASAANLLGLNVIDLEESKSQIAHGETVRETANMLSFLTEIIGIRDDIYPGLGDQYQREVIQAVEFGYQKRILAQRPVVINLQSDLDHPTQTLADLLKLQEYFGSLQALRNKKIAVTWAYSASYGKPMSVPQGLIALMTRLGMKVNLAYPAGYELLPEIEKLAADSAELAGSEFKISHNMQEAFADADIVYPKSWAPLAIMRRRTELWQQENLAGLQKLEKEGLQQNAHHLDWECNADLMAQTKEGNALYMHCLPADITGVSSKQGEVSREVFDRYLIDTYRQAGNKPFVIAAMMMLAKVASPAEVLEQIILREKPRKYFTKL